MLILCIAYKPLPLCSLAPPNALDFSAQIQWSKENSNKDIYIATETNHHAAAESFE